VRILALDLETSPNIADVWGLWQQNVGLSQLRESTQVICWGARWLDAPKTIFRSVHHHGREKMLADIHSLLDQADAVLGWNSKGFDVKHLNREFIEAGLTPPSPYKHVDLMLAARATFRFPSNKLDYVAQRLGAGAKVKHEGHSLWTKCMLGDNAAWNRMRKYQIQDVDLLVDLYAKFQPWLKLPNANLWIKTADGRPVCAGCGKVEALQRRGLERLRTGSYHRLWCNPNVGGCGKWSREVSRVDGASAVEVSV